MALNPFLMAPTVVLCYSNSGLTGVGPGRGSSFRIGATQGEAGGSGSIQGNSIGQGHGDSVGEEGLALTCTGLPWLFLLSSICLEGPVVSRFTCGETEDTDRCPGREQPSGGPGPEAASPGWVREPVLSGSPALCLEQEGLLVVRLLSRAGRLGGPCAWTPLHS